MKKDIHPNYKTVLGKMRYVEYILKLVQSWTKLELKYVLMPSFLYRQTKVC